MNAAADADEPHRLEHIERALDIDAHDVDRARERREHADDGGDWMTSVGLGNRTACAMSAMSVISRPHVDQRRDRSPSRAHRAACRRRSQYLLRAAVRYDFPVNILCWDNLDAGAALIDRYPDVRFIMDHLGILQPRTPPAPLQPWANLPKVLDLAKRPNVVIKVSGACTLSREPYPFPDIWDPLARVFDAWGFDRCLRGTDWTRAFAVRQLEQAVEPFRRTQRLSDSERAMLMGGACAKAYGLVPPTRGAK